MHETGRQGGSSGEKPLRALIAVLVGAIFIMNITCAFQFILNPDGYLYGFEVSGVPGTMIVQSIGILFLMWNLTYPPVILWPVRQRVLFMVVLLQQVVGIAGESWLLFSLPAGHPYLARTAQRFIFFDTLGLLILVVAFSLSFRLKSARE